MNEQWSCAGICVEPQSEQRSLGTNQQATAETHNLSVTDRTTPAASISTATTPINFPNCSSTSSSSHPDCVTGATSLSNSSAVDGRVLIPCSTVSLNKVEEQKSNSCSYEPSSSVPTDNILLSSSSGTLTDETYPSTSTADTSIFDEKATLQDCQLSRLIRRRCRFLLPSNISHKLLRIALKQPATLKHLSITSVKVGESNLLPVVVNDATLSLLSLPYPSTGSEMNSLAGVPVNANATDRANIYDPYQSENGRHELTPSTSAGHIPGKRKAGVINNDIYQTGVGMHGYMGTVSGQSNATNAVASVKQQQSQTTSNTSSPLLVNLLRSSSPVANAGMHNLQHTHMSRPSAAPIMQHMSAPSPQTQGTVGYSSYPYMGQSTMNTPVQPGRMRPSATSVEVSHLTTSTHAHSEQQQMRPTQQEVNMERHQQVVATQQQSAPAQQLPQAYYPQYNQRRPMLAGFTVRGQIPQQHAVYAQQGQMMPPHYIHVQQQPRLTGQPLPVHFHQTVSLEHDAGSQMSVAAPPPKKRKRPTKKQLKEAELAQQAAAAAAQQQFIMEQQMNSRVPSANAHTVDRPTVMSQVMHSGQPSVGITYAQHPQGYPSQTLRSPPAVPAQTGPIMQNPSSNPSFYQQQNVWVPQHQQQIMSQQRPQIMYSGQMHHHWQNNQSHHSRMIYPQTDSVSEMSAGSSGSVHTSPMTSRNASIDYSPASQSSSTMSPLYQQQQPNMTYQQPANQQTPPSALTYSQSSPSQQQVSVPARPQQQQTIPMQMQESQQQQPPFSAEQQCLDMQPKSCLPVLQSGGDFEMDDELGANIADDCGDYNDLDSIEPMTESSEFGATLMASHQQQMQQRPTNTQQHMQHHHHQQQQQYYSRMLPPQNRYDIQSPMQHQSVGYMRQMCSETQMRQCSFPSTLSLSQQQQSLSRGYSSPQQQQQPAQGASNLFMSPPPQPSCSPSPYTPRSSPQKDSSNFTTRQQQPRHIAVTHQQYAASPLSQQQSIRTPLSAPPTVHSQSQLHPTCGRIDDLRSSRSDGEATPRASTTDSNVASIEYDKDPINSTIDAVVMRALSDQDSFSSTSISNYFRGSRNRLSTNIQSSTAEQTGTSDRKMMGNNVNNSMRPVNAIKQPGQFQSSQQAQQFSNTDAIEGSGVGASGSHNGQATGNSAFPSSKTLVSASRESFHGGNSEMHGLTLSARQQKDQRISDRIGDQRSNNTAEHHHLTNGHESLNMLKERGYVQSCNGVLPLSQSNDDERRLTGGLVSAVTITDVQQPQRSSPKVSGTARRNRRKADLSLEALSYDDEDEITVPTFGSTPSAYQAPYMRRVGGPGSIVVGCSGNTPTQPPFANISVQSAQNNFSATVARQQQMLKQQPKTS